MCHIYARSTLVALSSTISKQMLTRFGIWRTLTELGISRSKPTRRGCRAGQRKRRLIQTCMGMGRACLVPDQAACANKTCLSNSDIQEDNYLHMSSSALLNIQSTTKTSDAYNAFVTDDLTVPTRRSNVSNLIAVRRSKNNCNPNEFGPSLLMTNSMSLAPKIDEVRYFVVDKQPDVACITETWLKDTFNYDCLHITGYNLICKNRSSGSHGGVCTYIKNTIQHKSLDHLHHSDLEVLWTYIKPKRLPRGIPCLIIGTVYHPPSADDKSMLDFLTTSLTAIEGLYPGCGFMIVGDFNRLNISRLLLQFRLKQLVRVPTRADQILDLIITNLPQLYDNDSVQSYPPFGLSDHNVIMLQPKVRPPHTQSRRVTHRRDTRKSKKQNLGRYLSLVDWSILDSVVCCEDKERLFIDLIMTGLDTIMPLKKITFHVNDPPWISAEFKNLIKLRQKAFVSGDMELYRRYRNRVNRERKICRSKFFSSKVQHLKKTKPSQWWCEIKKIAGMVPATGPDDLLSQLHFDSADNLTPQDIASSINNAFLQPMQAYQPLASIPPFDNDSVALELTEIDVCATLLNLNPRKAFGPDGVPNWLLKEYAYILANPVCSVINSTFADQVLPSSWKRADVIPLIKTKPVTDICKHLRPISLTPSVSKVAEDFVVSRFIGPAILERIDVDQFGAIPKSSTTHALISMVHKWSQATDATGAAVRIALFDYTKAFDLIDHSLLVEKITNLPIPRGIVRWVCDFLFERKQRVKLSNDCVSEWGDVPSGVPQGTKLGPWLFLLMINDLRIPNVCTWKYVDDTTVAEVVPRGSPSHIQNAVAVVEEWSSSNKLQLNAAKCKELIIDFKNNKHVFDPITVNGKELPIVTHAKILGVTLSNNLQWNHHLDEVIKKANKRLYFLVLLKRANVPANEIVNFYCICIRPVLEYCATVFHHSLPNYLNNDLERVQKRALNIISPAVPYQSNLDKFNICTLYKRREDMCDKLFKSITNTASADHRLNCLLPSKHVPKYNLRRNRKFSLPSFKTNRFKQTFIPSMCSL